MTSFSFSEKGRNDWHLPCPRDELWSEEEGTPLPSGRTDHLRTCGSLEIVKHRRHLGKKYTVKQQCYLQSVFLWNTKHSGAVNHLLASFCLTHGFIFCRKAFVYRGLFWHVHSKAFIQLLWPWIAFFFRITQVCEMTHHRCQMCLVQGTSHPSPSPGHAPC